MVALKYIVMQNTNSTSVDMSLADVLVDTINGTWNNNEYTLSEGVYTYSFNTNVESTESFLITLTRNGIPTQYLKSVRNEKTCSDIIIVPPTETIIIAIWVGRLVESTVNLKLVRIGDVS